MPARLVALLALAITTAAILAAQSSSAESGPPHDSITGSGWTAFTDFPTAGETTIEHFAISAHAGPAGEDPDGTIVFHSPLFDGPQIADVTCLVVDGNRARVGGEFRELFDYIGFRIRHIEVVVEDLDSDDRSTGLVYIDRPRPPGFSPCDVDLPAVYHVVQGNYVVRDAT